MGHGPRARSTFDANGDSSQKFISFYKIDTTLNDGTGGWAYVKQQDFAEPAESNRELANSRGASQGLPGCLYIWHDSSPLRPSASEDDGRAADRDAHPAVLQCATIGGIYALIALGYTMVYGIIELINFAHGEIFMVGAFMAMFFLTTLGFIGRDRRPGAAGRGVLIARSA